MFFSIHFSHMYVFTYKDKKIAGLLNLPITLHPLEETSNTGPYLTLVHSNFKEHFLKIIEYFFLSNCTEFFQLVCHTKW